jgi:hypothetical protein
LSTRVGDAQRALAEAKVRHEDIKSIERSIDELVQLFQDMSLLLDTQQDFVNTIEVQADSAASYVEEGNKEVEKAIVYRKKARRVCITFFYSTNDIACMDDLRLRHDSFGHSHRFARNLHSKTSIKTLVICQCALNHDFKMWLLDAWPTE